MLEENNETTNYSNTLYNGRNDLVNGSFANGGRGSNAYRYAKEQI